MQQTEPSTIPKPGSDEAIALGCTCPVVDNARGRGAPGWGSGHFWFTSGCTVHVPLRPLKSEVPE